MIARAVVEHELIFHGKKAHPQGFRKTEIHPGCAIPSANANPFLPGVPAN
jgi:hypothetical protein